MATKVRVFLYRGFMSEEECDYLISQVHGKKNDNLQSNGLSKAQMNDGLSLGTNNEIATRIEEKISAWTFLPKENSESLRVLHFGPEDSKKNYNYFDKKSIEQVGGQPLLATVVLYLSNVTKGGQILFPESENKMWSDCAKSSKILRPTRGNAIVFFNLHINATPDSTSVHARCPVLEGEMWYATKFFYLKWVKFEKEVQQSNDADCTDEDDNCPRWAAVGECQRNSVFMIGSPDYYGTCRKSCNVC
ncbi:hypothetical protein ACJIZ3_009143 [Penstemon smallii]|uniref:procollagen-proline 4-dioxygenase n=1 Tax=Penstemon smallii TaxID=265156 RepID=A0ABD3TBP3_9LAMI